MSTARQAFTMIELVFVIVIIGILASISIPKLAATRMDAKLAAKAQNIATAANEIASYALSRDGSDANLSHMSRAIHNMIATNDATDLGNYTVNVKVEEITDCIIVQITNVGSNTETLSLLYGNSTNSNCDRLRSLIDTAAYPILLHGTHIIY